jgi:hypothetical protein
MEPTTIAAAITWIDSKKGNHEVPPISQLIGQFSISIQNGSLRKLLIIVLASEFHGYLN